MNLNNFLIYIILPLLSLSLVMIFIRVIRGPRLMDRVVALDLLVIVAIAFNSAYSILYEKSVIIEISLILALIAFLSTVAFTYYYQKGGKE